MPTIPGFWDVGPHDPIDVEVTWREFVQKSGGEIIDALLPPQRTFENADFLFRRAGVVAELKEVSTEFAHSSSFKAGFDSLMTKLVSENPSWKPALFGGKEPTPAWFNREFVRLFRPPISRILKKANRQLRDTKEHFGVTQATGTLLFVNDGFTAIGPEPVRSLASSLLLHSYSSIDCFVFLTVNRYVEVLGSDVPRLVWAPVYSDRAPDWMRDFINALGSSWFEFIEAKVGPFSHPNEPTDDPLALVGAKPILLPPAK